jgi:threonine dehydrogenase-like Zn-dependent dehydrogenase
MLIGKTLPKTFKAGVLNAPMELEIVDIPIWPLASYNDPDLVMIKVEACGVCGSDFRYFLGENPWAQHTLGQFKPNAPNIVLGHEYAGTVVAVQSDANLHLLGQRVAPICSKVCGHCRDCQSGREHLCANTVHLGHGQGWGDQPYFPGAYGRYAPAWGTSCHVLPDHISMTEAAMMDILAVCVHVANQGNVQPGNAVLCIGGGPAGNGVAQVARSRGANTVVILDSSAISIEIGQKQGFVHAINVKDLNRIQIDSIIQSIEPNMKFDSVFDTVGTEETIDLGLAYLEKGGTLVNMAVHDHQFPMNYMRLSGERKIVTSCNFQEPDFAQALKMLARGDFQLQDWFTATNLDNIPAWFGRITKAGSEKEIFKLIIEPGN